jgi:hypothetical protein
MFHGAAIPAAPREKRRSAGALEQPVPFDLRDRELLDVVASGEQDASRQLQWPRTRIEQAVPHALIASG